MLAAGAVVVNTFFVSPGNALVGIVLILIGAPAYVFWRRTRDSALGPAKQP
jgi:hypothetical protein